MLWKPRINPRDSVMASFCVVRITIAQSPADTNRTGLGLESRLIEQPSRGWLCSDWFHSVIGLRTLFERDCWSKSKKRYCYLWHHRRRKRYHFIDQYIILQENIWVMNQLGLSFAATVFFMIWPESPFFVRHHSLRFVLFSWFSGSLVSCASCLVACRNF